MARLPVRLQPRCFLLVLQTFCWLSVFSVNSFASPPTMQLPGTSKLPSALQEKLQATQREYLKHTAPRTAHLTPEGKPKFVNRLILETSPYLQQHAFNPVNWYPWGEEAFSKAKELQRPIFLSVGYSTCHWCHVMEEESFEDLEIADYLNRNYVSIKVDREERPDIDAIYMTAVQIMNQGRGGWPMSVWLTHSQEPFYAGTYFPPRSGARGASLGFLELLKRLTTLYTEKGEKIREGSAQITQLLRETLSSSTSSTIPGESSLHRAAEYYRKAYDETYGGVRSAPKFPSSFANRFLLRYARRSEQRNYAQMVLHTLRSMSRGGIRDHLAGGFHRYSTDEKWLVPHFEKMLYDNALIVQAYLEAFEFSQEDEFKAIARETLSYISTQMMSAEGLFYSATDADSLTPKGTREEGWYFTWTLDEITRLLEQPQRELFIRHFGISKSGNFEGRNIPFITTPIEQTANALGIQIGNAQELLQAAKSRLLQARANRPAPLRDEKIITAWNAMTISAFASASLVLQDQEYQRTAARAAEALFQHSLHEGMLFRTWKSGRTGSPAFLDDYAFLIAACLDLFESTQDLVWLERAIDLEMKTSSEFEDKDGGGYFMSSQNHEKLISRQKPAHDGAEPSGNSVMALNLLRLHEITTDDVYQLRAEKIFRAFADTLEERPQMLAEMLLALDFRLDEPKEILIVLPTGVERDLKFTPSLAKIFTPNRILAVTDIGEQLTKFQRVIPLFEGKKALNELPTAYVCTKGRCKLPTNDPDVFLKQVSDIFPLTAKP